MFSTRAAGFAVMCAFVGVAMGAAVKFRSMEAVGMGMAENPRVDGMASYKYDQETTFSTVQVVMQDLKPGKLYSVLLESDVGGVSLLNAFTTNPAGNGQCNIASLNIGDLSAHNPKITIFIWDGAHDGEGFPIHIDQPDITDCNLIRAVATDE
jgi:hypothetical protein